MGRTTAVAHGGNPHDRAGSPTPRWLPKTVLPRCIAFGKIRPLKAKTLLQFLEL
ncbi:hypothetical protein [Moorena sp. SIO4G3]|uniref:hypothetical protein n=1 Tax=Moorena sp. SIO4G3 TaxID=2607821 RepID=UPI001429A352|nr:hypothetical protein [Moorena sp. SIO4G3]NEO79947.1 hypothetical protein [Moorena sp. SIO4G3]